MSLIQQTDEVLMHLEREVLPYVWKLKSLSKHVRSAMDLIKDYRTALNESGKRNDGYVDRIDRLVDSVLDKDKALNRDRVLYERLEGQNQELHNTNAELMTRIQSLNEKIKESDLEARKSEWVKQIKAQINEFEDKMSELADHSWMDECIHNQYDLVENKRDGLKLALSIIEGGSEDDRQE